MCWFATSSLIAQTTTENYILTKTHTENDNSTGITQIQYYDGVGRESQQWLPAPSENSDGSYIDVETFKETQLSFYADPKPFTQTNYEPSPVWHSNQKKDSALYTTNTLNEVRNFQVNTSDQLINEGYFDQASLYKLISIDPDGKSTTEYKDKIGRIVMKRLGSDVNTAFVYNDLNQLCYVIPPKAYDLVSSNGTISHPTK